MRTNSRLLDTHHEMPYVLVAERPVAAVFAAAASSTTTSAPSKEAPVKERAGQR